MFVLTYIRKAYKILSADASPSAIAFAAAFGLTVGLVPFGAGIGVLLALLILILRVQLTTAIAFVLIGALLRIPLAPAFIAVGDSLLDAESLRGFWKTFLNLPVVAWMNLEYSGVLGAALVGAVLGAALFLPLRYAVIAYRRWAHDRVSKNKFFRWLTNFWLTKALRFVFVG